MRLLLAGILLLAPNAAAQGVVFQTSVAPKPEEDIATDCRYEITIPNPSKPIRAVWVIFDRGRDMLRYYGDSELHIGEIWPSYFRSTVARKPTKTWTLTLPKELDVLCLLRSLNSVNPQATRN